MKKSVLFGLLAFVFNVKAQNIQNNKVNVFTLKIDYLTHNFEGGDLAYYDCLACTNDSLPFDVIYHSPGDFGDIAFVLNEGTNSIFSASIIWMGMGVIDQPQAFVQTEPFINQQIPFALPSNVRLFDEQGYISSSTQLMQDAQSAWTSVEALGVVRQALENDFKVGMYLYTPSVGVTDWSLAKWIVFLYKNTLVNEMLELKENVQIYPNPTQNNLQVKLDKSENHSFEIKSLDGKVVQQENLISNTISVSNLVEGMYFLEIKENDKLISRLKFQKI